ncbi:MAG: cold-shock protein [Bdellovibrionales bacterium]|nr:cold shock domain-containing protein [Bdellovibrionales bacterium]NQZ19260.1 cold-shock protein [Bdellovibrionales bacterium]
MSEEKQQGRVKWFRDDKGFGFIEIENGNDIFVHVSQVTDTLNEGDKVEFIPKEGKKGPVATEVKKID